MSIANLRISTRLGAGFAVVLCLTAVIAGVGTWRLSATADEATRLMEVPMAKERLSQEWFRSVSVGVRRTAAIAKSSDPSVEAYFSDEIKASTARAGEIVKSLEALPSSDEEKKLLAGVTANRQPYIAARDSIMKAKRDGKAEEAQATFAKDFEPTSKAYLEQLRAYLDFQNKSIDAAAERIKSNAASGRNALALLGVLAIGLGGIVAWVLSRSITQPLQRALVQARAVAEGDLTQHSQASGQDEVAELHRAMDAMQSKLSDLVRQVRQGVDSVSTASQEIARGNTDLSQRTEQAASNLQQTASSIEQLTSTVRQTADSASTANQLASSASAVAQRGGEVVSQVVSTMNEINASSKKIADIIGTIDGIAFQTNILALNAAVEAARAGEQGRGFAVVAGEVRSLAQRSAEAAREIKSLIGASVDKVESGSRLVADAGSTMTEIVASVQRVSDIIGEISAAAAEQSGGIGQVNQAVNQLDQATQQNAALVEQSAAAAESLQDQSRQLGSVVAGFRIDGGGSGFDAPRAAPAAVRTHTPAAVAVRAIGAARTASASASASASSPARPASSRKPAAVAHTPAPAPAATSVGASVGASAPAPARAAAPAPAAASEDDWETF
jgi:methyl-accepting chemotaxis protein